MMLAALPISSTLTAQDLYEYHKELITGLIARKLHVVSYGADGTETERKVQQLFVDDAHETKTVTFDHPYKHLHYDPIEFVIPFMRGPDGTLYAYTIVQDSKHARKTFRNNMFTGARVITLGNGTTAYSDARHILEYPFCPIFRRDIFKLDRQDDLAAARLFSAETLSCVCTNAPDKLGLIVYLYIFGEVADAWQNRAISHQERVRMIFRARFFVEQWRSHLYHAGYPEGRHFISREAMDIFRILSDGLIKLILIYRDYLPGPKQALLPWLHGTEVNEHYFGLARQQIPDFTYLNFLYMAPSLEVLMNAAYRHKSAANAKARAAGYHHTHHLNDTAIDYLNLATFPDNDQIKEEMVCAAEEATSLWGSLLGGMPRLIGMKGRGSDVPSVHDPELDNDDDNEVLAGGEEPAQEESTVAQLHKILDSDDLDQSQSLADARILEDAAVGAVSLLVERNMRLYVLKGL